MTDFEKVLQSINNTCLNNSFPYIIIGGFANILHGSGRTTRDVDIVIFVDYYEMKRAVNAFEKDFKWRIKDPLQFVEKNFVLPLTHQPTEIEVDVSLGFSGFEKRALSRSKKMKFKNVELNVCTAEDLILFKLVAARPRDLLDIQEVMQRFRGKLDVSYLLSIAEDFREVERSDVFERLTEFLAKYYGEKDGS